MGNKQTELNNSGNQVETVPVWVKPYLTIDEATAYTDMENQHKIQVSLQELCREDDKPRKMSVCSVGRKQTND